VVELTAGAAGTDVSTVRVRQTDQPPFQSLPSYTAMRHLYVPGASAPAVQVPGLPDGTKAETPLVTLAVASAFHTSKVRRTESPSGSVA
jgi:hypothetical protein